VQIEDPKVELNDALKQLAIAVSLSIALIFLTMVFQFGSIMNSLLVLVAVPLGFIGVLTSLFIFQSSLSLNSLLGVILLNGLAVANSIILVDFLQRKVREGVPPRLAAVEVARVRLRPILMTSLTTGLGMLPIAIGFGEGGKILQPLGIAVAGGLSFSMVTTLFIVPALQVSWLEWSMARKNRRGEASGFDVTPVLPLLLAVLTSGNVATEARAEKNPPVAFQEAFQSIMDRNLKVAQQKLEVEKSEHRRMQAYGAFAPKIEVDYSQSNTTANLNASSQTASNSNLLLKGSLNIFRSGGDLAGLRGAERALAGSRYQLSAERQSAEKETVQLLTGYIARVLERKITERSVEFKQDSLRIANERFARGLLPMQEVHKVAIDLDNIKAKLSDIRGQDSAARASLVGALGHDNVLVQWPWKEAIVQVAKLLDEDSFRVEARPDWMSLTEAMNAAKYKERQALGTLLPTVDFTATYGSLDLAQSGRSDWTAMMTLSVPLFNGFQDLASYRTHSAQAQKAALEIEALRRQAPAEVDDLRRSFREAREAALAREKNVKLTEKLYADNLQRFRIGRASANELAYDFDRLLQAQIHEVEGWRTVHMTFVRLCHAIGASLNAWGQCVPLNFL
jgi:outer membrane protein TolC